VISTVVRNAPLFAHPYVSSRHSVLSHSQAIPYDLMYILVYGMLYLLLSYVPPLVVYAASLRNIQDSRASLSVIMVKAFYIQLFATIFIWSIISILSVVSQQAHSAGASLTPAGDVLAFFSVDWMNVNIQSIYQNLVAAGSGTQEIGIVFILILIWVILSFTFFILPMVGAVVVYMYTLKKHDTNQSGGTSFFLYDLVIYMLFVVFSFGVHLYLPELMMRGFYAHPGALSAFESGLPKTPITYTGRIAQIIKDSKGVK